MGFFDFAEKAAKYILTESDEEKEERKTEKQEEEKQKRLDTLRSPMRTFLKKGDISENEMAFLKSTAYKLGIDAQEFKMRFDIVRSARNEYLSQGKGKGMFSSEKPDLFFYTEDEVEDYFAGKMGSLSEVKIELKVEEEMHRPHFDSAFDEAFGSIDLSQESPAQQQMQMTPPPMPTQVQYTLSINGQNQGPYDMQQLQQMVQRGQLTLQTYVWKQGMANWDVAGNVKELSSLFSAVPPPPPSIPPALQ